MKTLALVLLIAFLGLPDLTQIAERKLLYPFSTRHLPPAVVDLPGVSEQSIATPDGETLIVWTAPPEPGRPTLVYLHGNAGDLAMRASRFRIFGRRGFGLIVPAYRGSSGSTGTPSQATIEADMSLILNHFSDRIADAPVIYYGESLGAAVAIHMAAERPPAALVLESPFTSIPDVAAVHYPRLVDRARRSGNTWPSLDRMTRIDVPLLILHGKHDQLIPPRMGRALHDASPSTDKRLFIVEDAGHVTVWQPDAQRVLYRFLDRF